MTTPKGRVVNIDVQGQQYAVRSELAPAYIAELANYVDQKMQQAARETTSADSTRERVAWGAPPSPERRLDAGR